MMEVSMIAESARQIPATKEKAIAELKERLWHEVWKDAIELPQAVVEVREYGQGRFRITVKL